MNNVLEKLKSTRILAGIGVVFMILGTIFPYASYDFLGFIYNVSLWKFFEGKIILLIAIANLILIFKDIVEKYIPSLFNTNIGKKLKKINNPKAFLIPTIIGAVFVGYLTVRLDVDFSNYSLGFYSMWIGVICLVAFAFIHKKDEDVLDNRS